jgi:hypothetical protein
MDNEDALEIDRAADEERSKKTVSFGESLMPFKKPEFNPATMTGPDMMFQQVFVLRPIDILTREIAVEVTGVVGVSPALWFFRGLPLSSEHIFDSTQAPVPWIKF